MNTAILHHQLNWTIYMSIIFTFLLFQSANAQLNSSTAMPGGCYSTNGMYVDNVNTIVGNAAAETTLLNYARNNGVNYLIFYSANQLVSGTRATQFAALIRRAKTEFGIHQIGAICENASADAPLFVAYNNGRSVLEKIDVFNLEFEFWAANLDALGYCGYLASYGGCTRANAFRFYIDQINVLESLGTPQNVETEVYIGWATDDEARQIANAVDRVLIHAYRQNDVNIIEYTESRLRALGTGNKRIKLAPIFSSEGPQYPEAFMGTWLLSNPKDRAFETWLNGYNALTGAWKNNIEIMGQSWYSYIRRTDQAATSHITGQPANQTACLGQTRTFTVNSSATNKQYNWMKNGICLTNGGNISGANTATLTITNVGNADLASYSCRVVSSDASNPSSFMSNAATLSISASCNNVAPTVSLTSPSNNASFIAPAVINIAANAADTDGSIARVEFYNGTTLLNSDATAPYAFAWNNVVAGSYSITARAFDNAGAATTSTAVNLTVNNPTPVQSPYGGAAANIPGTIQLENYDLGGQGVAFNDATPTNEGAGYRTDAVDLEAATGGGFNIGWTAAGEWTEYTVNVTAGTYKIDARVASTMTGKSFRIEMDGATVATFNVPNTTGWQTWQTVTVNNVALTAGQKIMRIFCITDGFNLDHITFSNAVTNQAPTVSLTAPTNNATFTAPASITLSANASDADGSIARVEFFNGTTLLNSDATAPYAFSWSNVAAGSYTITARATDNAGATTTSAQVNVTVSNATDTQAPSISLTAPNNGTSFNAPASISIAANASDNVGVSRVEFYNGATLLSSDANAPYGFTWTNVAAGSYTITARAFDAAGNTAASAGASVTVNTVSTNACSGIPQYSENGGYAANSRVQNAASLYQCKPFPFSGWCNGAAWAYAPGTGIYWNDAWTLVGSCTARDAANNATATVNESMLTNAPNPFNGNTNIEVNLAEAGEVSVIIFDKAGQKVATVVEGNLSAGTHHFDFDASQLTPGMYIVKCNTTNGVITRKIVKNQ
jgi:hypothetical protein